MIKYILMFFIMCICAGCVGTIIKTEQYSAYRLAFLWPTETRGFSIDTNGCLTVDGYITDGGEKNAEIISKVVTETILKYLAKNSIPISSTIDNNEGVVK